MDRETLKAQIISEAKRVGEEFVFRVPDQKTIGVHLYIDHGGNIVSYETFINKVMNEVDWAYVDGIGYVRRGDMLLRRLIWEKHNMAFALVYADHPDRRPVAGAGYAYHGWRRTDIPVEVRLMERSRRRFFGR